MIVSEYIVNEIILVASSFGENHDVKARVCTFIEASNTKLVHVRVCVCEK